MSDKSHHLVDFEVSINPDLPFMKILHGETDWRDIPPQQLPDNYTERWKKRHPEFFGMRRRHYEKGKRR